MIKEDATQRVLDFYERDGDEKILEGKIWVQGIKVETLEKRITYLKEPLYFDPGLRTAQNYETECMQVLLGYLQEYQPLDKRGLIFFPSAKFSLYIGRNHLTLYMQEEKEWGQGVAIDVFNQERLEKNEFEEMVRLMKENKTSSFTLGRLRERKEYDNHVVLRRYFPE